ncbi:TolC family outer membrane protein [Chromatiaceae bacterium AAb-1]|nr:TolC family outer membrane protein [Chromatiaceae bacterium AAb-1]
MKNVFTIAVAGFLLFFYTNLYAATEITLAEATKRAIESNPEVQEKWHIFLASDYDIDAARAGYKPAVDLNSGYGYQRRDYGPNREFTGAYAELSLNQMLYDGSHTRSEVKRFSRLQLVRYFELLDTVENTALTAINAYQDVLRFRELVRLAEENLSKHVTVYRQIEESSNAGVARAADLEQVSGRLSLAESNLIVEIANLHDVSARYLRIIGELPAARLTPAMLYQQQLPASIQQTLEQAYQTNPSYHAAIRNILSSEAAIGTEKANFKPRLNLTARYGVQNYDDLGFKNDQAEGRVGIELRYNFYNGGRDKALLRRAAEQVNVAKDLRDKVCLDVRQTLQVAFNDTRKINEQLPVLNQHRLSSDKVRTAYKDQFDIGQRTLLDVLDAENEYFQASRAYSNATFDLSMAVARTLTGMGQLLSAIELVRDGLPTLADLDAQPIAVDPATACPAYDLNETITALRDDDGDGVANYLDHCPDTPAGDQVDRKGCSVFTAQEVNVSLNLLFGHNSDIVSPSEEPAIAALADYLQRYPDTKVEIQGHTSAVGKDWYNRLLSQRRADAVARMLNNKYGVATSRITATGYAAGRLKVSGNTEEAHRQNRRTEASITAL